MKCRTKNVFPIALLCVFVLNCGSSVDLAPTILTEASPSAIVDGSTTIILGHVVRVDVVNTKGPIYDGNPLELLMIKIEVESIFKGSQSDRSPTFYRYDCARYCRDGHPSRIEAGQRYVFMLVTDGKHLRSTRDVAGSFFSVAQTGELSINTAQDPRYLVAQAVLAPGQNSEIDAFIRALAIRSDISIDLVGRTQTVQFLAPLLGHASADLRREACFVLAKAMYDYQGCLSRILVDPFEDEGVRVRAKKRLAALGIMRQRLHSAFLTNPERWLEAMVGPDPNAIKDLLNLLSSDPDMLVRKQAARVLERSKFLPLSP